MLHIRESVIIVLNRLIRRSGLALVRRRSVKMLIEDGNVLEIRRPVEWLRHVARVMPETEIDRTSTTVRMFRREGR